MNPTHATRAVRICVIGAECTGKTALARAIGRHYSAPVLPEVSRDYFARKAALGDASVYASDIARVVELQSANEDSMADYYGPLIVLDTDVFAIDVWHERYAHKRYEEVGRIAAERQSSCGQVDLYVLTCPDIPFVHDGVRSSEGVRDELHDLYLRRLAGSTRDYVIADGPLDRRLITAVRAIDPILGERHAERPRFLRGTRSVLS